MINERAKNAVLGALVADAASLGFHWLYDQSKIRKLAPTTPEFRNPDVQDYAGVMGYFAHGKKQSGDLSQYGEQVLVMLHSLVANQGEYEKAKYQAAFVDHFGYGGEYVGYIDGATRTTLNNVARLETAAMEKALALPFNGPDDLKSRLMTKIVSSSKFASGDKLRLQVERAVRLTDDSDANVAHAQKMTEIWESVSGYPGSNDIQLPAIAKLPALVAHYAGDASLPEIATSAIKVTHNNDTALEFGLTITNMIESAILTGDIQQAINAGKSSSSSRVAALINESLTMSDQTTNEATKHFGLACDLAFGVPSVVHNVNTTKSYTGAIRNNIYAAGDNCGRSTLLGALMGACYGVGGDTGIPNAWIEKLPLSNDIEALF